MTTLPWDILLYILSHIDTKGELSTYMRTCRTLYTSGTPYLVQNCSLDKDIELKHIVLFCKYLLQTPSIDTMENRASFIRKLRFPNFGALEDASDEIAKPLVGSLAGVIQCARFLERLTIEDVEYLIGLNEDLAVTVSSLENLQKIKLSICSKATMHMLSELISPLRQIDLSFDHDDSGSYQPPVSLAHFADTLEKLTFRAPPAFAFCQLQGVQFSHVHTFIVASSVLSEIYQFRLSNLTYTFPNLKNLGIDFSYKINGSESLSPNAPVWSSLDTIACGVSLLLALDFKIPCRLWSVCLSDYRGTASFRTILQRVQPTHLELKLGITQAKYWFQQTSGLDRLFQVPSLKITHLSFCFVVDLTLDWVEKELRDYISQLLVSAPVPTLYTYTGSSTSHRMTSLDPNSWHRCHSNSSTFMSDTLQ